MIKARDLPYQTKSISASVKDVDSNQGIVTGYFSTFDVLDSNGDIIRKGAFRKTIKERGPESDRPRVKHLWMHDPWQVLGAPHVLKEDSKGLYFETRISQTSLGKDILTLYEDGVITEHSIGYDTIKSEFEPSKEAPGGTARILTELRLWDGSSVTWGANPETPTLGLKGIAVTPDHLTKTLDSVMSVLKHGHLSTDEICEQLEVYAVQLKSYLKALEKADEPDTSTQQIDEPQAQDVTPLLTLRDSLKSMMEV